MPNRQLIHLSDLHIGFRKRESDNTRAVIRRIASSYPGVPVIITGDITDSATEKQFRNARALIDELARTNPVLAAPGNHDYAWKGTILNPKGWAHWVKYFGSPLGWSRPAPDYWMGESESPGSIEGLGLWVDGPFAYFGIDSGDPMDKQLTARGFISKKLANALKASLDQHKGKTRIVFLHHHPFTGGLRHIFTALHGARRLMDAVRHNCELLLFGHEHEYGLWWDYDGIPLIVSSHKTTESISGNCCALTVIEIENPGKNTVFFQHRLEMV